MGRLLWVPGFPGLSLFRPLVRTPDTRKTLIGGEAGFDPSPEGGPNQAGPTKYTTRDGAPAEYRAGASPLTTRENPGAPGGNRGVLISVPLQGNFDFGIGGT